MRENQIKKEDNDGGGKKEKTERDHQTRSLFLATSAKNVVLSIIHLLCLET